MSTRYEQEIIALLQRLFPSLDIEEISIEDFVDALTHPSYKGMVPDVRDYERLEFLGDAVLDLISAEELVRDAIEGEGIMTEKRKQLVNNDTLATIFDYLKIKENIRIPTNFALSTKIRADFVEAIFGALYLNLTFEEVKEIWDEILQKANIRAKKKTAPPLPKRKSKENKYLEEYFKGLGLTAKNPKSVLQELSQKQGLGIPEYDLIARSGPDHSPVFLVKVTVQINIDGIVRNLTAEAEASNKKKAEIEAAKFLCEKLGLPYENA